MNLKSLLAGCVVMIAAALPATAQEVQYSAVLSGPAEAPPNASPGVGTALVTFDLGLATMRVQASFSDLVGATTVAHIHCCTVLAGASTAGVATQTPTFIDFPAGVSSGTYDHTFDMAQTSSFSAGFLTANGDTAVGALDALLLGIETGRAYFNVHSSEFGGGEIRGFLAPLAVAVPEPETYALFGLGLGVLAWVARRRRTA